MPHRTIIVRGLQVEIWKTSFRVEGMSGVLQVSSPLSDAVVVQFVETVFDAVAQRAEQAGRQRAANALAKLVMNC